MLNLAVTVVLAVLAALCASLAWAESQQRIVRDPFQRSVPAIVLNGQTIFQAIARLYVSTGIVVSVERMLDDKGTGEMDRKFTATIPAASTTVVLNEICALDGRYAWSRDGNVVNIYPSKTLGDPNYLFNRRIPVFHLNAVSQASSAAIQADEELPGPRSQLILLGAGGTDFAKPWTVTLKNLTLRMAMNRIAQHLCATCGWQLLKSRSSEPTVMFYYKLQPEDFSAEQKR